MIERDEVPDGYDAEWPYGDEQDVDPDGVPTEPDEGDLVTEDHRRFYRHGFEHKGPAVVVGDGEPCAPPIRAWMEKKGWFPNVWFVSDHGNCHLIDLDDHNT